MPISSLWIYLQSHQRILLKMYLQIHQLFSQQLRTGTKNLSLLYGVHNFLFFFPKLLLENKLLNWYFLLGNEFWILISFKPYLCLDTESTDHRILQKKHKTFGLAYLLLFSVRTVRMDYRKDNSKNLAIVLFFFCFFPHYAEVQVLESLLTML